MTEAIKHSTVQRPNGNASVPRASRAKIVGPGHMHGLLAEVMRLGVTDTDLQRLLKALHDDQFSDIPFMSLGPSTGVWFTKFAAAATRGVELDAIAKVLLDFFGVER